MTDENHWETIYSTKADSELSWTEVEPSVSLSLIQEACSGGGVVDVGGGSSVLASRLLDRGYSVAVLDISPAALARARARLGARADQVRWIVADVKKTPDLGSFDVWHDRALFHFLTDAADRALYAGLLSKTVGEGGHAVIATFAEDGPERCSGLRICRYSGEKLAAEAGRGFKLVKTVAETHLTPWGRPQSFQYSLLRRLPDDSATV